MVAQTTAERTLTIGEHTATVATWQRAIAEARAEGVMAYREGAEWYATSVGHPGERHHVNGACACQGARRGLVCKHLAAVASRRYSLGELQRCQVCGRVGPVERMHGELRWVGGHGYEPAWYCGEGYGHQAA